MLFNSCQLQGQLIISFVSRCGTSHMQRLLSIPACPIAEGVNAGGEPVSTLCELPLLMAGQLLNKIAEGKVPLVKDAGFLKVPMLGGFWGNICEASQGIEG